MRPVRVLALAAALLVGCAAKGPPKETDEMRGAIEAGGDVRWERVDAASPTSADLEIFVGEPRVSGDRVELSLFAKNRGAAPAALVVTRIPTRPAWEPFWLRLSGPGVEEMAAPMGPETHDAIGRPTIFERLVVPPGKVVRLRGTLLLAHYRVKDRRGTLAWELRLADAPKRGTKELVLSAPSLHDAVDQGWTHEVERALREGADPNAKSRTGATPLESAADGDRLEIAKLLLAKGAKVEDALRSASLHGHLEMMKLLLDHGADPNRHDDGDANTPLHWAAVNARTEAVRLLLARGARVNEKNKWGATPLDSAHATGMGKEDKAATVEVLVRAGGVRTRE